MKNLLLFLALAPFLLFFTHTTVLAMENLNIILSKHKKDQKELFHDHLHEMYKDAVKQAKKNKYNAQDNIKMPMGLLNVVSMAKICYLLNEDNIADHALGHTHSKDMNLFIYIAMQRIKKYTTLLAEENKICPSILIPKNQSDIFTSYKLYIDVQKLGNNCGFNVTSRERNDAFLQISKIPRNHGFEEFNDLIHDLFYLKINGHLWNGLTRMLLVKKENTLLAENTIQIDHTCIDHAI